MALAPMTAMAAVLSLVLQQHALIKKCIKKSHQKASLVLPSLQSFLFLIILLLSSYRISHSRLSLRWQKLAPFYFVH